MARCASAIALGRKVLLGALTTALLAAQVGAASAPNAPAKQPKLVVPEPVFDFTEVDMNSSITHEFVVRNDGAADLQILGVAAGCSCTAVSSDPTIAPGKSGVIRAVLDTTGIWGAVAKQITVSTNDPETPRTTLTVKAMVKPSTAAKPELLRLEGVRHEPAARASAILWALDGDDFMVTKVESSNPSIRLSFSEVTGAAKDPEARGRQWRIEAELDPLTLAGPISALAQIETNQAHAARVMLAMTGVMSPLLMLTPAAADLGEVLATPQYLRELRLENLGAEAIRVERVESDVAGVSADIRLLPDGKHTVIGVRLASSMPKGPFAGKLTLKTSSAAEPILVVPLSGNVL